MKKVVFLLMVSILIIALFGCETKKNILNNSSNSEDAYFSMSEDIKQSTEEPPSTIEISKQEESSQSQQQTPPAGQQTQTEQENIPSPQQQIPPQQESPQQPDEWQFNYNAVGGHIDEVINFLNNDLRKWKINIVEEYSIRIEKNHIISSSLNPGDLFTKWEITLHVSKGRELLLPIVPYQIKGKNTGVTLATITKMEVKSNYPSTEIWVTFKNNTTVNVDVTICFRFYDKNDIFLGSHSLYAELKAGESAKDYLFLWDDNIYKIVVDDESSIIR